MNDFLIRCEKSHKNHLHKLSVYAPVLLKEPCLSYMILFAFFSQFVRREFWLFEPHVDCTCALEIWALNRVSDILYLTY
jgi:hypothetical protein